MAFLLGSGSGVVGVVTQKDSASVVVTWVVVEELCWGAAEVRIPAVAEPSTVDEPPGPGSLELESRLKHCGIHCYSHVRSKHHFQNRLAVL